MITVMKRYEAHANKKVFEEDIGVFEDKETAINHAVVTFLRSNPETSEEEIEEMIDKEMFIDSDYTLYLK